MSKKIDFMCTAFRDGFQSCYGARVLNRDFLPAMEAAHEAGINWFEHGGGAIFQSKVFYCNENPFDAMDEIRAKMGPDVNLQTLARGVNVVGLQSQSSEFIKLHAQMFKKHGVTTIRNFDALNDVNNLNYSGRCIHEAGLKHQITITFMGLAPGLSGAHDPDFYEKILRQILKADIPFDSLCFKDASGTLPPALVHETVKRARKILGPDAYLQFHSHCTVDAGITGYLAAIYAGINAIDLSLPPMSEGTAQPDIMTMWHNLRGTEYTLDIDIEKIRKASEVCKECMSSYFQPPESQRVAPIISISPMPGGALTANTQMLRDFNEMHLFNDCIAAMAEVVAKGGFGTSVTPVSQFYFQQAYNNVKYGPWEKIAEGYGNMVLGYIGRTPCEPDPEIVKICSEKLGKPVNKKPVLELNDADPKKSIKFVDEWLTKEGLPVTDENRFIVGACKEKGILFLQGKAHVNVRKVDKEAEAAKAAATPAPKLSGSLTITVNGVDYTTELQDGKVLVNGRSYDYSVAAGAKGAAKPAASSGGASGEAVKSPMSALVIRAEAAPGASLKKGDTILVLEAMKMEVPVKASRDCKLLSIEVSAGDQIAQDAVLAYIQ